LRAGLPVVSDTGLPVVMARGVGGFGRIDLPVAQSSLPEVRGAGIALADLPSVGDALPAVVGQAWDSHNLPAANRDMDNPFGDFGSAGDDPFAGSEADFGAASDTEDPFGGALAAGDFGPGSDE